MEPIFFFIIIGIAQGILEWLPISSEGQVVFIAFLFTDLDNITILSLSIWLHLGTMFSVIYYYREDWGQIFNLQNESYNNIRLFLVITTIGTAIVGIPIRIILFSTIEKSIGELIMWIFAIALIFTAILLQFSRSVWDNQKKLKQLTWYQMLIIGFAQGLTIIPGVSRSGTTVSVILMHQIETEESFRGSFFMSVPAVLGAIGLDLFDAIRGESMGIFSINILGVILAVLLAFIFGILTMKSLLSITRKYSFVLILFGFSLLMILFLIVF